jgi:2-(1,2-epoxy-1,2-dihydrophenyl)acetyl-CoA isomerase
METRSRHIRMERRGAVGVITIDRRERMNSMDVETARDFRRAGLQFAREAEVRAVIIRGSGGIFSSGADLKYIRAGGKPEELGYLTPEARREPPTGGFGPMFKQILEYIHSTISEIRRAAKPFIAAVDGVAAAGGLGIAISCDVVIASERAVFEWAYGKTGLTGAESSTFFLPRLVGLRRALDLAFLNPKIDAKKAVEIGLASMVLPVEGFDEAVLEIASRIASGPTRAFGITKNLMNQSAGVDRLDVHLDRELEALSAITDGPDFIEGLEAFFARRPPLFTGKG